MRKTLFLVALALLMPVYVALAYFVGATDGVNDCSKEYARRLANGEAKNALLYDTGDGIRHVDVDVLPLATIGRADGVVVKDTTSPVSSVFNTASVAVAYAIYKLNKN